MENLNIQLEDIKEAYQKLKTHVYYDSYNLHLRVKLAEFESNKRPEDVFASLLKNINDNNIDLYLYDIKTYILPKKISREKNTNGKNNIVRNDECELSDKIKISDKDYNFYIDAPIELHLLDTLWIMKEGCFLIDENIKKDCYGNTLVFENSKSNHIKKGPYLFERYFDKYQSWRDRGIKIAREQTKHNNDVLLVCLDIQRFYPTSQVKFDDIKTKLIEQGINITLTSLLEKIYVEYQSKLGVQDYPQLPIGLLSAGVIANWYLSNFDTAMKDRFNPIYYGRYVDDIFMVLGNVKPECDEDWFREKFLYDDQPLFIDKDTISENKDTNTYTYCLKSHRYLKINKDKIKIFYFAPEHSLAILDNFQKKLDENSSAFWFFPEYDDINETLNNKGFDIIYNDSINKFREISSVKNNRYGVSVFLTQQIRKEIICRNSDRLRIKEELFKYFVGDRLIDMYTLWEKVFTYFVVSNDKESFNRFYENIQNKIEKIEIEDKNRIKIIKKSLQNHCIYCLCMAFALNYDMIDENKKFDKLPQKLRKSYLIRQHYTPFPIIIYTNFKGNNIISYDIYNKLLNYKNLEIRKDLNSYFYLNPRTIHIHEISMIEFFKYIKFVCNPSKSHTKQDFLEKVEQFVPYKGVFICDKKHIELKKNKSPEVQISKLECRSDRNSINEKIKVALSNIKINEEEIISSIKGVSLFNSIKQQRHYHLLNLATEENVDCLVLPEVSIPIELLITYAEHSRRKQQLIIAGLEHTILNDLCYNFSIVFLPYVYKGQKEVLILPRLKNHYSPNEEILISKYNKKVPLASPFIYHLINWRGIQFTVFNCYELANVFHRSLLRSQIDVLFAIEYNKDTYYYSNIVEATCRDLHCYFVQANTSDYGDSRLSIPKRHVEMTPVKIKGGENDTLITFTLDIKSLRDFQLQNPLFQDTNKFKNTPPGFNIDNVKNRGLISK